MRPMAGPTLCRTFATGFSVLLLLLAPALSPGAAVSAQAAAIPTQELVEAPGRDLVTAHCSACHSLALVTQNRGDAAHWKKLIRWMQAEHNLWDLGPAEPVIVDYLAQHYGAPERSPRRAPLDTDWHEAEESVDD